MVYAEGVAEEEGVGLGLAGLSHFSSPWGYRAVLSFRVPGPGVIRAGD